MNNTTPRKFVSMTQLEREAASSGSHFFEREARQFFGSRIGRNLYGGRYFVTSEQYSSPGGQIEPRRYTVRRADWDGERVSIETVGEFQQYDTREAATSAARKAAGGNA